VIPYIRIEGTPKGSALAANCTPNGAQVEAARSFVQDKPFNVLPASHSLSRTGGGPSCLLLYWLSDCFPYPSPLHNRINSGKCPEVEPSIIRAQIVPAGMPAPQDTSSECAADFVRRPKRTREQTGLSKRLARPIIEDLGMTETARAPR